MTDTSTLREIAERLITVAEARMPRDEGAAARYVADELRKWSYLSEEDRKAR